MIRSRDTKRTDPAIAVSTHEIRKCIADPVYFIENFLSVQHPVQGTVRIRLSPEQVTVANAFKEESRIMVSARRQTGSTTLILALTLWSALFGHDQGTTGYATISQASADRANEMLRTWVQNLPAYLRPQLSSANWNELRFASNSRIITRRISVDSFRGQSLSALMIDGLSYVPQEDQQQFVVSIFPALSNGSKIMITGFQDPAELKFLWESEIFRHGFRL